VGKKTENKAVGVSRGGRNTKIHALVDGLGNPLAFLLSSGNDHDSKHAIPLLSQIDIEGSNILGDKAYGAKATILIRRKLPIRFLPRAMFPIRGRLIGIPTKNGTWLNASFKNSSGFAECLLAMTNSTLLFWPSSTLPLSPFC